MAYLVLARKYRPQSFADVAGQEHVVRTLANALKSGQLAHAFLFTGPRGVGKTTSARLVAKALNCVHGPTAEPCGACPPCVEIAEGRSVDVIEIDAASNNGVDNVRDIVEAVKYRPARDRFKVFVVDEVHMLSMGAFNALLKTLEEPPEHVKFVLATTDVHKVPETIVSRCQRFDFKRLTQQQIVETLRRVMQAEGMRLSDAALALIARAAEGGMRDALSMVDQVRAACGDAADDAAVAEAVGAIDAGAVSRLASALVRRDGAALLKEVEGLYARGQEMKRVAEELVRHLRNVVVAKLVPDGPLDLTDAERREVVAQAEAAPAGQLTRLFDIVQRAAMDLKQTEQTRYALEVALLKACFLAPGSDVQELIARIEGMGGGSGVLAGGTPGCAGGAEAGARTTPNASARANPSPRPSPTSNATATPNATPNATPIANATPTPGPRASSSPQPPPSSAARALADDAALPVAERWRRAVAAVERSSLRLAAALKQAALVSLAEGEVSLRLAPGMPYDTVERGRAEIEALFARHFAKPVRLALAAGAAQETGAAAPPTSLAEAEQAERAARTSRVKDAARKHANIEQAAKILDGEITKIDEL